MKILTILCMVMVIVASVLGHDQQKMNLEVNITSFEQFKDYFGKIYESVEVELTRKANVEKTLIYVLENYGKHGVKLRINPMADLSEKEFLAMHIVFEPQSNVTFEEIDEFAALPFNFDWRNQVKLVNPVEQQGSCGSCWAFATLFSVETLYAYRYNMHVQLSKQELVDCSASVFDANYRNKGCLIGYPPDAFKYIMQNGVVESKLYPYKELDTQVCYTNKLGVQIRYHIHGHNGLAKGISDETIQSVIHQYGPVAVVIHGTHPIFRNYHGGIIRNLLPNSAEVNHVVTVIGWGTENGVDYWTVRNSWGSQWGELGYARIERHHNNLALNNWCSYAILN